MLISKALINLSKMLNGVPFTIIETIFNKGLEYTLLHLDHFVENVRHSAQAIFQNFTRVAIRYFEKGNYF